MASVCCAGAGAEGCTCIRFSIAEYIKRFGEDGHIDSPTETSRQAQMSAAYGRTRFQTQIAPHSYSPAMASKYRPPVIDFPQIPSFNAQHAQAAADIPSRARGLSQADEAQEAAEEEIADGPDDFHFSLEKAVRRYSTTLYAGRALGPTVLRRMALIRRCSWAEGRSPMCTSGL
jgi:hypothetical protein